MKKSFPGYYQPTDDEFKKIWENCVFVIDANVLLNLYRYSPKTSEELINILEKVSDRLWLPHQATLEYLRNRLNVIQQQADTYKSVQEIIKDHQNKLENEIQFLTGKGRHPFINSDHLIKIIASTFIKIQKELKELQESHPNLIDEDPIKNKITELFNGKVGPPYTSEYLKQIFREGKDRFEEKVPPGFKDHEGKDSPIQFGDLILWFQIIDYAKANKRPIIFVTDDRKDDWWLKLKGRTLGPRPELINEIVSKADISFYMYSTDPFLLQARSYLDHHVSQHAIEEVQEIREQDERDLENINSIINTIQVSNNALAQARAAVQFPSFPYEFWKQFNMVAQIPSFPDEYWKKLNLAAQIPKIPDEFWKQLNAGIIFHPTLTGLTARTISDAQFPNVPSEKKEIENGEEKEKPADGEPDEVAE